MRVLIVRDLHDYSLWQGLDIENNPKKSDNLLSI